MRKLVTAREAGYNIEPTRRLLNSLVAAHVKAAASTISLKMAMNLTSRWCNDWKRTQQKWGWCCATWRVSMPTAKRVGVEAVREDPLGITTAMR